MKDRVTEERSEPGSSCNLHTLIKLLFRSLALHVRAPSAPPIRHHIHSLSFSNYLSFCFVSKKKAETLKVEGLWFPSPRSQLPPPTTHTHTLPPFLLRLSFISASLLSSSSSCCPVLSFLHNVVWGAAQFPLKPASLPFCAFFYSLSFIFCLSAALPVRLIAPCRASVLRFPLFFIIPASPVLLASLPSAQFLPYFTAKMFPLSHFQHLTEHTWNLFIPVSSSPLLFPLLTSPSALVCSHKYAFLLDTANSVQAPGCQKLFGPCWVHTYTHTPESGDFLTCMQTHSVRGLSSLWPGAFFLFFFGHLFIYFREQTHLAVLRSH